MLGFSGRRSLMTAWSAEHWSKWRRMRHRASAAFCRTGVVACFGDSVTRRVTERVPGRLRVSFLAAPPLPCCDGHVWSSFFDDSDLLVT